MFYRLKSPYLLRGWEGMAWTLVKRPENHVRQLSQDIFQTLLLCDGETTLEKKELKPALQKTLKICEENGYIEACQQPKPLDEEQYYRYYHNRYIQMAFWSVTGRCNFHCRHCYMDAPDAMLENSLQQKLLLSLIRWQSAEF